MFTQLGAGAGLASSNLVVLIANVTIGEKSPVFLEWGWRLPFLLSSVLIVAGMIIRLKVSESPEFLETKAAGEVDSAEPDAVED